jgi:hypothetical protein
VTGSTGTGPGSTSSGSTSNSSGSTGTGGGAACSSPLSQRIRITTVDVGSTVVYNEVDTPLTPLAISPIPSGGSRVAWMGNDGNVHIAALDANDQLVAGSALALPASDFQDLYADNTGGVVLVSKPSAAGGTDNCGTPSNLCGTPPNPPIPCFDMYMVRFDGTTQTWATKLTDSTATSPPYLTSPTDPNNLVFIWWYAHNGRIVFDGTNYGTYFGAAISVSQGGCVNIHQGDRMKVVSPAGAIQGGGFDWGCSHSGYERILWDPAAKQYVTICKNDLPTTTESGRLALAPNFTSNLIMSLDLYYSDLGSVLTAGGGGYWAITSNIRMGQTPNANGLADIHLAHFTATGGKAGAADKDIMLVSDAMNDRAPHLAAYGSSQMLAAWEESTATGDLAQKDPNRKMYVQILDKTTGAAPAGSTMADVGPLQVAVLGSRYQDFRTFPDGSVAYPAPGGSATQIKILRVLACH